MTKKILLGMLLLVLCLGCALSVSAQETVEVITLVDDLEREIEIPVPLTSVVTLAPSLTETLYYLDADDLIVAVDINSDFPESIAELDKVTGWDMSVNYEAIVAMEPDLVLASEMTALEDISNMEALGLTVFCIGNPEDFLELFDSILLIGEVVGKETEAEALTVELADRVAEIDAVMEGVEETPLVFYEIDASDPTKPWTSGKGTFISELIRMAGGINMGDSLEGEWIQVSLEALLDADPQIILLGDSMYGSTAEAASARPGWDEIDAVKNGKLYEFDDNLVTRPGPRLVDGYEMIARFLHPELFE